jgi:uncharacterized membrane protein required for colicin V production
MDWGITGLIDVIIILLAILMILIGYFKGFMNKALSIFGFIMIAIFAAFYSSQLSGLFKSSGFIYDGIYKSMLVKIEPNLNNSFAVTLEKSFGIPSFIATILAFILGNPAKGLSAQASAELIASRILLIISFLIIFTIGVIILIILKIITKSLREQKVIRVIDGIFGIAFYLSIYAAAILLVFFILDIVYKNGGSSDFNHWLEVDLALNNPNKFRIGKYFLENNFLVMIKDAIFK